MDNFTKNAQNVVSMTDYNPDQSFAILSQVEAYWDALRGDQLLPKRSDIDPRGIENALEFAFILERVAPGVARLRIAGSHLSDLMGMEVRGMPITAFLTPASRRQFSDMMEEVFELPATAMLTLKSDVGDLTARMILLPLKSDMGDTSRMLGCLMTQGDMTDTPCRFDIQRMQITSVADKMNKTIEVPTEPAPQKGFAEPTKNFEAAAKKRRPHYLRLVKSED